MALPRHVAIIMDGNGRWAAGRGLPRAAGHKAGLEPVRMSIKECARRGIEALTVFAFSSENWRRPQDEISNLMSLFLEALEREIAELHQNQVRIRLIGDRKALSVRLQSRIAEAEQLTSQNNGLKFQVAVSYGGRWDIVQASQKLARDCARGVLRPDEITEEGFASALSLAGLPELDLFIRTGGERRISNFMLWDLAYTELYFCDRLWPEFDVAELEAALDYFAARDRRYGSVTAQ
jgi:undecaprenyl diphosphate synthase